MDVRFTAKGVPATGQYMAQRWAVLRPLMGDCHKSGLCEQKTLQLVDVWRERIDELRREGWPAVRGEKDYTFARNCQPSFITVRENKLKLCKRRYICPFCFARDVADVYGKIAAAVFAPDGKSYELAYKTKRIFLEGGRSTTKPLEDIKDEWPAFYAQTGAVGGFFNVTAAPSEDGLGSEILIRYILMVHESLELPDWLRKQVTRAYVTDHTKLAEIIGEVMQYPVGWIKGDPDIVCSLMSQRHGLRLSASFGRFRGQKDDEQNGNSDNSTNAVCG